MSWVDAKQYVAWLSQLTGKEYRFLTEAEMGVRSTGRCQYPLFLGR